MSPLSVFHVTISLGGVVRFNSVMRVTIKPLESNSVCSGDRPLVLGDKLYDARLLEVVDDSLNLSLADTR